MTSQQPYAQPSMAINAVNTNPLNKPVDADGRRDWNHGLFDCFGDCGTCCVAWFCPCIVYGKVKHRHQGSPDQGCCNTDCMIHGVLMSCGFGFAMQFMLRGEIRHKNQISGGAFTDCLTAFCCTPCELTQESRELDVLANSSHVKA